MSFDGQQRLVRGQGAASADMDPRRPAPGKEPLTSKLSRSGAAVQARQDPGSVAPAARSTEDPDLDMWADAAYLGASASDASAPGKASVVQRLTDPGQSSAAAAPAREQADDPFRVDRGQLTFDAEGTEGGRFHSRHAHWPGGASGVTIGRGYDLGQHSRNQIITDMTTAGVSSASAFAGAAGLSGNAARNWLNNNRSSLPEITPEQQKVLFDLVYGRLAGDVERISGNYARTLSQRTGQPEADFQIDWNTVHPAIRDVLVDLRYRGDYRPDTRTRVQPPAIANDLRALYDVMRDRAYWMERNGVPQDRFQRRVQFLETALRGSQEQQPGAGNGQQPGAGNGQQPGAGIGTPAEYEVTASSLNVRSSPDAQNASNRIGALSQGEKVTGAPTGNGWVEITFQGQKAYVSAQFLAPAQSQEREYTVTASALNVRAAPDASSTRLGALPQGEKVTGTPTGSGWVEIRFGGQKAYVSAEYVTEGSAPQAPQPKQYTVTASALNVRAEPDAGSARLGALQRGESVTGTPTGSGWVEISFGGQKAYVSAEFLSTGDQQPGTDNGSAGPVQLSGARWVQLANQNGWVNNTAFSSLDSSWGPKAQAFVTGLRAAGAGVNVTAGLRHPKRAHLMHYAWGVAGGQYTAAQANAASRTAGVPINWDHGSAAASRSAAQALKSAFGMVYQASLTSNHVRGLAIDMTISNLPGSVSMNGKTYTTRRGASGTAAAQSASPIGRDMGVIWYGAGDWVHWSHNGR